MKMLEQPEDRNNILINSLKRCCKSRQIIVLFLAVLFVTVLLIVIIFFLSHLARPMQRYALLQQK